MGLDPRFVETYVFPTKKARILGDGNKKLCLIHMVHIAKCLPTIRGSFDVFGVFLSHGIYC